MKSSNPFGNEQNQHNQEEPQEYHPVLGHRTDVILSEDKNSSPNERSPESSQTAQKGHHQNGPPGSCIHNRGRDRTFHDREKNPADSGEGTSEHPPAELVAMHMNADKRGSLFILSYGLEDCAKRGSHDPPREVEAENHHDQGDKINRVGSLQSARTRLPKFTFGLGMPIRPSSPPVKFRAFHTIV